MNSNPYESPRVTNESPHVTNEPSFEIPVCVRRIDVVAIAVTFGALGLASYIAIAFPAANEWFKPRFGSSGNFVFNPVMFLCLYLWKPAPRLLATSSFMFFFIATIDAATIAYKGTVPIVTNAYLDRLPSAYAWSVLPLALAGMYIGLVAWRTRHHLTPELTSAPNGG